MAGTGVMPPSGEQAAGPGEQAKTAPAPLAELEPLPDPPRPFNGLLKNEDPETAARLAAAAPDPA